jgi:hypothetical protein
MNNTERFDETIKNALDNIEEPYDASTWAQLAGRLEAMPKAVDADTSIDDAVRDTLVNMEAPYQAAHWAQMSRLLDQQLLRRRLLTAKAAEAAIFLLLLLNFNLFIDENSPIYQPRPTPPASAETPVVAQKHSNKPARRSSTPGQVINNTPADALLSNTYNNPALLPPVDDPRHYELAAIAYPGTNSGYAQINTDALQAIDQVATTPLLYVNEPSKIQAQNMPPRSKGYFYAGAYAAHDQNRVIAPFDVQAFSGYRGGFAAGWRKGKWGIEVSLAQASLRYTPKTDNIGTRADVQSQLIAVDANLTTLSVKGLARLGRVGKKTSIYATTGSTASTAVGKNYSYETTIMPGSTPGTGNTGGTINRGPEYRVAKGALEGGSFTRNTYISADAGLRIERPVGGRFAVFVEPVYRHAVMSNNIGQVPTRINTMSVQAGVLATL